MAKRKPLWVLDAEATTGMKWNELSIFDKLQFQKRYPAGRVALNTPMHVLSDKVRFEDRFPKKGKNGENS